jgi:hypothetical protein
MTQAFNLAQLANNLNTSGQLDATDGLSGLVTNANLASSGTASSTTFLRGDRTWAIAGLQAASTAEAQAGTSDTVAITPLKMRQGFNATGSAPVYASRAWVVFNGSTATISASGNVSSITYITTGRYTVNFTTALPNANYAVSGSGIDSVSTLVVSIYSIGTVSTTSCPISTTNTSGYGDNTRISVLFNC